MAYVDEINEDEEQGPQGSGEVVTSSGSGSTVPSGGNQGSSNQGSFQQEEKASSTGWTNLQNYVSANKGAASRMAGDIAEGIGQTAQSATQAKQGLASNVRSDVAANTVRDQGLINNLSSDPTKVDKEAYQAQRDARYSGPTDVQSYNRYADVQRKIQGLGSQLQNTETEEGRRALLKQEYGRPDYGYGAQTLDSFIIGASPESQEQIAATKQQYGGLADEWQKLQGQLGSEIQQGIQATEKTAADTRAAYDKIFGQYGFKVSEAEKRADDINRQRDARLADLTGRISSGDASVRASAYRDAGINPDVAEYLLANGVSPSRVIKDLGDVGIGNYLSAEDAARYRALAALEDRGVSQNLDYRGAVQDFGLDQDFLSKAARAREIQTTAERLAEQRNAEREAEYNRLSRLSAMDPEIRSLIQPSILESEALSKYGDRYGNILARGLSVDTGDVLDDQQRQEWKELADLLGLQSSFKYQDTQDEGKAYRVDEEARSRAIAGAVRDLEEARARAEREKTAAGRVENISQAIPQVRTQVSHLPVERQDAILQQVQQEWNALDPATKASVTPEVWIVQRTEQLAKEKPKPLFDFDFRLGSLGNVGISI